METTPKIKLTVQWQHIAQPIDAKWNIKVYSLFISIYVFIQIYNV